MEENEVLKLNIVEENAVDILELLIEKYLGKKESALSKFLRDKSASEVSLEITPQKILHFNYSKRMRDI